MDKKPLKRAVSGWALLDWCWPLPLGLFIGVLVFAASAGTWLVFREPSTPRRPPPRADTPVSVQSPARGEAPQPPPEYAPPAPAEPSVLTQGPPVGSTSGETASARAPSQSEQTGSISSPGLPVRSGRNSSAPKGEGQAPRAPRQSERPSVASPLPAAGSRLSPAQEAKLRDTLVRGRWYMKRGQYGAALEEFQAALAMDPANREAQAAIQQARGASANPKPQP